MADNNDINKNQPEAAASNLSDKAKLVAPYLVKATEALRNTVTGETKVDLIKLANKIIGNNATGPESVDFKLRLAELKNNLLSDPALDQKGKTILENYFAKVEKTVFAPVSPVAAIATAAPAVPEAPAPAAA